MSKKENKLSIRDEMTEFLLYTAPEGQVKVEVFLHDETIWLPQKRIAELFEVGVSAISKHLDNIYESGELEKKATISILETVQQEGRRHTFTMESFAASVNKFLKFNGYKILEGYGTISRKQADGKAFKEYEKFNKTQHIKSDFDRMIKKLPKGGRNNDQ